MSHAIHATAVTSIVPKQLFQTAIFLLLACTYFPVAGQAPITISPNPANAPAAEPGSNEAGEAFVTHLLNETAEYRWARTVLQFQGGEDCVIAISDKNITYIPALDSYTFELGPEEADFPLFSHLINWDTTSCCALVHLVVHPVGDTTNAVTAAYSFGPCLSGTAEQLIPSPKIQPNPVSQSFTLANAKAGTRLQLFDLNGQLIQYWEADTRSFSVEQLPKGVYLLVLLDNRAVPFEVLKLIKN